MTTYNDFIADLTNDNLLDGAKLGLPIGQDEFLFSKFNVPLRILDSSSANLSLGTGQIKLPDFSVLQHDFQFTNKPDSFVRTVRRKKVRKSPRRQGEYCNTCGVRVPSLSLRYRFCHTKIVNSFVYYSLIGFSLMGLSALILLILFGSYYS